jgi:hypothetical protein
MDVIGMLLAIASLGGTYSMKEIIDTNIARAFDGIAIVLASVSIVAAARQLLWLGGRPAAVATLLARDGCTPFFAIPSR